MIKEPRNIHRTIWTTRTRIHLHVSDDGMQSIGVFATRCTSTASDQADSSQLEGAQGALTSVPALHRTRLVANPPRRSSKRDRPCASQ